MMFKSPTNRPRLAGMSKRWLAVGLCVWLVLGFNVHARTDANAGARTFQMFCAGCHGHDGFAAYQNAPSFSMGERLQKDDRELLQTVLNGNNFMPPWRDLLPIQDLRNAIAYIRLMNERRLKGEAPRQEAMPEKVYMFKPFGGENMDRDATEGK